MSETANTKEICEHCKSYVTIATLSGEVKCPVCGKEPDPEPFVSEEESYFVKLQKGKVKPRGLLSLKF